MTAVWGPMGWITLHSISVNYPEYPKADDKVIVKKFLELFIETISCPSCKGHFGNMYKSYTLQNPSWADSRYNLFLFVARAHNTVNNRLDKPRIQSVGDCLKTFQSNIAHISPYQFRQTYLGYLTRNWSREQSGEGYMRMAMVNEMKKINDQYWNPRELDVNDLTINSNANVLEFILQDPAKYSVSPSIPVFANNPNIQIGFKNGRLKLGGR